MILGLTDASHYEKAYEKNNASPDLEWGSIIFNLI
jgi:hypothetical protein